MADIERWWCPSCGIVRDVPASRYISGQLVPPWCRHNAIDRPAARMDPIPSYHPLAAGPLPWGTETENE